MNLSLSLFEVIWSVHMILNEAKDEWDMISPIKSAYRAVVAQAA